MYQWLRFLATASFSIVSTAIALEAYDNRQPASVEADAKLTADESGYRADLRELAARIKEEHPRPWRFISEADFDALVEEKVRTMVPDTTQAEFLWSFSEVLTSIRCGHSGMPYFNQEDALIGPEDRFPLDVRIHNGTLFVLDPLNTSERVSKGDEILSINGKSTSELLEEIGRHIKHEGVAPDSRWPYFNAYATSYLTYASGFPEEFTVDLANGDGPVRLNPLSNFSFKPLVHPKASCQQTLCYSVHEETNAGLMTMHSFAFYGERSQVFMDFVDGAFEDLVNNQRSALVIDIRFHNGGSGNLAAYLLRRLATAPFAYWAEGTDPRGSELLFEVQEPVDVGFEAPVYLLVDAQTVSSAPHFAALFREHGMGTLIGEPMGGNKSTNDGRRQFLSTKNGVEYGIARMRFDVDARTQPVDVAQQVDIGAPYSLSDVLDGEDSMMAKAMSLIPVSDEP